MDEPKQLPPRIAAFFDDRQPATPCLVIDLDIVDDKYGELRGALPEADVFFAVKACPEQAVLERLVAAGSSFDVASPWEIDLCLRSGVDPATISYGNTAKKHADIVYAYERGVRMFAFDSEAELHKVAAAAPGSQLFCRILTSNEGADWPLSRKFGCELDMAADLLRLAPALGLDPAGVVFHVGSQQRHPRQWDEAIALTARLFAELNSSGIHLRTVNLGGGFPARYRVDVPPIKAYGEAIRRAVRFHFGADAPALIVEPGRYLAGDAGVMRTEVVLVSWKREGDEKRWVYIDIGIFGGLAEAIGEAIKYDFATSKDTRGAATGPVVLAGPTCDSVDIIYEHTDVQMPLDLAAGDTIDILAAGAYTASYAAATFNGFLPPRVYCI